MEADADTIVLPATPNKATQELLVQIKSNNAYADGVIHEEDDVKVSDSERVQETLHHPPERNSSEEESKGPWWRAYATLAQVR